MLQVRSHYEVLGIAPEATQEEIQTAYHQKIRGVHSDITGFKNDAEYLVNYAYNVLKDPERRARYDSELRLMPSMERPRCPECRGVGKVYFQLNWTQRSTKQCEKCGGCGYAD